MKRLIGLLIFLLPACVALAQHDSAGERKAYRIVRQPDTVATVHPLDTLGSVAVAPLDTLTAKPDSGDEYEYTYDNGDSLLNGEMTKHLEEYQQKKLTVRKFDEAKWKKIVASNDFSEEPVDDVVSEQRPAERSNWSFNIGGPIAKIISYMVIGGLIIFIIYYIARNLSGGSAKVDKTVKILDPDAPVQNIDEIDIAALLRQAIEAGNYRVAVRLYYLDMLRRLNGAGKIVWMKDKTNRDYLSELFTNSWHFDEIRRLTLAYEQVWYGEHTLDAETFGRLRVNFEGIQNQITTP